jgi:hypothetical protein
MCWKMHYMTWWPLGSMWGQHLRGHWSSTKSHAAWMKWAWDLAWPPSTLLAVLEISSNLTGNDHVLGSFDSWCQVRKILQHSRSLNYMVILSSFMFSQTPWYPTSTWCHQTQLLLHFYNLCKNLMRIRLLLKSQKPSLLACPYGHYHFTTLATKVMGIPTGSQKLMSSL